MPSVTLTLLRDTVYRRLGDLGYFFGTSAPTAASTDAVDEAINASILEHVKIAESFGYKPLNDSADVFVTKDESPQVITINGSPTGVSFTLMFFGVETVNIDHDAVAAAVDAALNGVKDIQVGGTSALSVGGAAGGPYTVTWTTGDRPNIPLLSAGPNTNLVGGTNPSVSITTTTGDTYPREYNLDHYLWDANEVSDFRGDLVIWRTDIDKPVPVRWAEGGDFRVRESYRGSPRFALWPDELVYQYPDLGTTLVNIGRSGEQLILYRRGPFIGFVKTPTENMTLSCYYTPSIPLLVTAATDTLAGIGLSYLQDWRELIGQYAAIQLHTDINSPTGARLEARYAQLIASYVSAMKNMRHVVTPAMKRRWTS